MTGVLACILITPREARVLKCVECSFQFYLCVSESSMRAGAVSVPFSPLYITTSTMYGRNIYTKY